MTGFTLVELVMVLILVGILSLFVIPRFFDRATFDARSFGDEAQSIVRYAQKLAIARNASVFVCLTATSISAGLDNACSQPVLLSPNKPATLSRNNVSITPQSIFYFNALGRPFNKNDAGQTSSFSRMQIDVAVGGSAHTFFVESETGYVHQ